MRIDSRAEGISVWAKRLEAAGWEPKDAARYTALFQLDLAGRQDAAAQLSDSEKAQARALEAKYEAAGDFGFFKEFHE